MRRLECRRPGGATWFLALALGAALPARAEDLHRHRGTITVTQPAALVQLPLTPEVYLRSLRPGLADLRIVDARGERVPFALLAPRGDAEQTRETTRDAALYRLPPRPARGEWAAPVELTLEAGGVSVRQRAAARATTAGAATTPGYLIDLGDPAADVPAAHTDPRAGSDEWRVRLLWDGTPEFSAGYTLEHSADLKVWTPAPGGQISSLAVQGVAASAAAAGSTVGAAPLVQRDAALPSHCRRFVRLVWTGDGTPPALRAAQLSMRRITASAQDPPVTLSLAPTAAAGAPDAQTPRALHFDLGAALPLRRLDLELPAGTRVLPVQVQVRERADAPWRENAGTVFYRLDRSDGTARPPALGIHDTARWLRLVVDERAALPPAEGVRLRAEVQLASLVFSRQGQEPFTLLAGSADAATGALPLATLVPDLAAERQRFGRATVGAWSEASDAAAQAARRERLAAARPWLLWALLAGGVVVLAAMVWRLARGASRHAAVSAPVER